MIEFAHPAALWLLLLVLPIVLLYLLKQKRREVEVPSLLLWKQAIEDMRAHTPFQKLKSNLLLLLQILAIVLATAVLSQPYLPRGADQEHKWILVIDTSASMQARDEKPDRFTIAKERLLDVLNSLSASNEVMLISTSSQSSVIQPYSRSIDLVRQKLAQLKPVDLASNWKQLVLVLQPLVREKPRPKIIIASDFSHFSEAFAKDIAFEPVKVGKDSENIGITRAAMQPIAEESGKQMIFFQLENFGSRPRSAEVEISADNNLLDAYRIDLDPLKSVERTMELAIRQPSKIAIRLKTTDTFPLDDDFVWSAKPAQQIHVNTQIQDPFLFKALRVLPGVMIDSGAPIRIASSAANQPGIYFLPAEQTEPAAEVIQWNTAHAVLRFVDIALWKFAHCSVLKPPANATVLLETRRGPVAYAVSEAQNRQVVFGFSLQDSNLPLLAGFPVVLQNALDWIQQARLPQRPAITNEVYKFEGAIAKATDAPYVNFLDASESNIHPQSPLGNASSEVGSVLRRQDLSAWFLILLIAVVIVEWWVFHQRIHVEA